MKRELLCAVLTIGTASGVSLAQTHHRHGAQGQNAAAAANVNLPAQTRQAIEKQYPGAQIQAQGQQEENGIPVYTVQITPKSGQPVMAEVTEHGDFVTSGTDMGANAANLPAPVQELTQNIWKTPPADVRSVTATYYWVTLGAPGANVAGTAGASSSRIYALQFSPTGRLVDIKRPGQLHQENWQNLPDAPADVTQKLQQFAQQRFPNAKMQAVKQLPSSPGFYQVRFTIGGKDGWMITDVNQNISDEATTLALNELPQPVQDTIHAAFNGDRLVWAARNDMRFYQIRESVGNEAITMRVQPDGDVMSVHSVRGSGQAVPAGAHQKGQQK